MASENLTLTQIDEICDQFEAGWKPGCSPADLVQFVQNHIVVSSDSFPELFLELAQIEIEHCWKNLASRVSRQFQNDPAGFSFDGHNLASWHDPIKALPDPYRNGDFLGSLGECELKSRCRFGDVPPPMDYGVPESDLPRFQKLMPVVSLRQGGMLTFKSAFWSGLQVGRQQQSVF